MSVLEIDVCIYKDVCIRETSALQRIYIGENIS